jgi:hypothetical protein
MAAFAGVLTLAWLFIERRITTTAGLAGAIWAVLALTGGSLTRQTDSATHAVGSPQLQYVSLALAVLSFLALLLYRFDAYPPRDDDAYDTTTTNP